MQFASYTRTTQTPEEMALYDGVYGSLTQAVRDLNDAQLRTLVDPEQAGAVTAQTKGLTQVLRQKERPGSFGMEIDHGGGGREHGNAVLGVLPRQVG